AEADAEPEVEGESDAEDASAIEAETAKASEPEFPAESEPEDETGSEAERDAAALAAASAYLGSLSADFSFPVDKQPDGDLDQPDLDAELLDIFVEEGNDILDHADGAMAELRTQPQSHETLVALQRDLHTPKGGARMTG